MENVKIKQPKAFLTDATHYILKEDYSYEWQMQAFNADNAKEQTELHSRIIIKGGFRWDGASVPRILWWFGFKPDGRFRAAALIHDFIYIHKGKLPIESMSSSYDGINNQNQTGSFARKDADRLFGKMMKEAGTSKLKRRLMTAAVITFGWIYWCDGPDILRITLFKAIFYLALLLGVYFLFYLLK